MEHINGRKSFSPQEFLQQVQVGIEIVLPSGLEVSVRPVDSSMILNMEVNDVLMDVVSRHIAGKPVIDNTDDLSKEDIARLSKVTREFGELVARQAIVKPKLVDEYTGAPDTFPMKEMPDGDLQTLTYAMNVPLLHLKEFFRRQAEAVESVYAGEKHGESAVGGDGSDGGSTDSDGAVQSVPGVAESMVE